MVAMWILLLLLCVSCGAASSAQTPGEETGLSYDCSGAVITPDFYLNNLDDDNKRWRGCEVLLDEKEAKTVLSRRLLFNRFDFEAFTPGNLERECIEEVCNYEEAREVFENIPATNAFWANYMANKEPAKLDVTALLVGLICAAVVLILVGVAVWYFCQRRQKACRSTRLHVQRNSVTLMMRRMEDVPPERVSPPPAPQSPNGLPSYEQAMTNVGPHDAPPPPYPGTSPTSA